MLLHRETHNNNGDSASLKQCIKYLIKDTTFIFPQMVQQRPFKASLSENLFLLSFIKYFPDEILQNDIHNLDLYSSDVVTLLFC